MCDGLKKKKLKSDKAANLSVKQTIMRKINNNLKQQI